jgi:hypothetical protein
MYFSPFGHRQSKELAKTEKCHHLPELTRANVTTHILHRRQMMAILEVKFHDGSVEMISQVFCCTIHDTWENRKAWFVILRLNVKPVEEMATESREEVA